MGSSPKIEAPPIDPAETALRGAQADLLKTQTGLLKEQADLNKLLLPIQLAQAGLRPTYGQDGKVTGYEEIPDPLKDTRKEIEAGYLDRVSKALKGELPVNPALLKDLGDRETQLRETLRKNVGPGWETSTPGIEAMTKFQTERDNILEAARRGDLSLAESLSLSRESANFGREAQGLQMSQGIGYPALTLAGAMGQNVSGYSSALTPYANDRALALNASIQNASIPSSFDRILGGAGQLAGVALGGWAGAGFKKFWGA